MKYFADTLGAMGLVLCKIKAFFFYENLLANLFKKVFMMSSIF